MRPKNLRINWRSGMLIKPEHFIGVEDYATEMFKIANRFGLSSTNYGLLPTYDLKNPLCHFRQINGGEVATIELTELKCFAVTLDGSLIEVEDLKSSGIKSTTYELPTGASAYVVVSVDSFGRVPDQKSIQNEGVGELSRILPRYSIKLVSTEEYEHVPIQTGSINIALIKNQRGEVNKDIRFIPPCCRINAHEALSDYLRRVETELHKIEHNASKFLSGIFSIYNSTSMEKTKVERLQLLAERVLFFLAENLSHLHLLFMDQSPIYLVDFLTCLVRNVKASLATFGTQEKNELLDYIKEWGVYNFMPSDFEGLMGLLVVQKYEHYNTSEHLEKLELFVRQLSEIIGKVADRVSVPNEKESKQPEYGPIRDSR